MNPLIENKIRIAIYEMESAVAMICETPDPLDESNVLDISLADIGISQRSVKALDAVQCLSVRDVLKVPTTELRSRNVADCAIIDCLRGISRHFAMKWMEAKAIGEIEKIRAGDL